MSESRNVEIVGGECRDEECGVTECRFHRANSCVERNELTMPDLEAACPAWRRREVCPAGGVDALTTLRARARALVDHIHANNEPIERIDEQQLLRGLEEALGRLEAVGAPFDPTGAAEMFLAACGWAHQDDDRGVGWAPPNKAYWAPLSVAVGIAAQDALR